MKRSEMLSYTAEDINKMNKQQLLELARAEQKAIKDARYRLQEAQINAPALRQIQEAGNISAKKSMTVNQLRREIAKGRVMLNYRTSTVREARKVESEIVGSLSSRLNAPQLTEDESKTLWKIIDRMREADEKALLNTSKLRYVPTSTQNRVYDIMVQNGYTGSGELDDDELDRLYNLVENELKIDYDVRSGIDEDEAREYHRLNP